MSLTDRRRLLLERLDRLVDAYNRQDAAGVVALFAADGVFIDVDGTRHCGPATIEHDHRARFAKHPGSWFEIDTVAVDGDIATASWRRHRAGTGSGAHEAWLGVDVIRFDADGAILTKSTYAKTTSPLVETVADSAP